eukprot:364805-Chlamydomonas_euryale.AAC.6
MPTHFPKQCFLTNPCPVAQSQRCAHARAPAHACAWRALLSCACQLVSCRCCKPFRKRCNCSLFFGMLVSFHAAIPNLGPLPATLTMTACCEPRSRARIRLGMLRWTSSGLACTFCLLPARFLPSPDLWKHVDLTASSTAQPISQSKATTAGICWLTCKDSGYGQRDGRHCPWRRDRPALIICTDVCTLACQRRCIQGLLHAHAACGLLTQQELNQKGMGRTHNTLVGNQLQATCVASGVRCMNPAGEKLYVFQIFACPKALRLPISIGQG